MAMYKIPQDVEADDKFLGPLSFKQFIFAGITAICGYMSFLSMTKGFWPALVVLLPIGLVSGFLGFPWGRDQPTEIWLAARIRFFIKPRKRIWNQSGVKELVTITAPKRVEKHYSDGLSQIEVKSRLNSLATLLDSRGWAVKNVGQEYIGNYGSQQNDNDRLLNVSTPLVGGVETADGIDVLDERSNNTTLHFEEMIRTSEEKHRQEIMQKMQAVRTQPPQATQQLQQADFWYLQQAAPAVGAQALQQPAAAPTPTPQTNTSNDFWFLGQQSAPATQAPALQATQPLQPIQQTPLEPTYSTFNSPTVVTPGAQQSVQQTSIQNLPTATPITADEQQLLQKIHNEQQSAVEQYSHLKTIQPIDQTTSNQTTLQQPTNIPATDVTPPVDPAIMNLANNDDLSVATLAHEANKNKEQRLSDGEVVISLH